MSNFNIIINRPRNIPSYRRWCFAYVDVLREMYCIFLRILRKYGYSYVEITFNQFNSFMYSHSSKYIKTEGFML